MKRYLIIADDITGSNDTGLQLKRRGIDTVVTLEPASVGVQDISYVLDTESRPFQGNDAFNLVYRAVSQINLFKFDHIIKKVDSTLRGSIAWEIAAVDKACAPELIIFMPSLPDLGRTTIDGVHLLHGTPVTQTELAKDPRTPVMQDNLKKMLEAVYDEPVTHVNWSAIESGALDFRCGRVFSFDAVTNAHIQAVTGAAIKTGKRVLWVGTAGIVDNLLETEEPQLPAVALIASLSETTRRQVRYAQEKGTDVVVVPTSALIKKEKKLNDNNIKTIVDKAVEILRSRRDVIVISEASYDRAALDKSVHTGVAVEEASSMVQRQMGGIMANILERACVSGIFLTGGDTAMGFLNAINATGMRIVSEALIGIPLMRIVGGKYDNVKAITKAGAFGQDDALSFCLRKLKEKDEERICLY